MENKSAEKKPENKNKEKKEGGVQIFSSRFRVGYRLGFRIYMVQTEKGLRKRKSQKENQRRGDTYFKPYRILRFRLHNDFAQLQKTSLCGG